MKLSAPKFITWIIAVVLGLVGILIQYGVISVGIDPFLLVTAGFVLLAIGAAVEGL